MKIGSFGRSVLRVTLRDFCSNKSRDSKDSIERNRIKIGQIFRSLICHYLDKISSLEVASIFRIMSVVTANSIGSLPVTSPAKIFHHWLESFSKKEHKQIVFSFFGRFSNVKITWWFLKVLKILPSEVLWLTFHSSWILSAEKITRIRGSKYSPLRDWSEKNGERELRRVHHKVLVFSRIVCVEIDDKHVQIKVMHWCWK